MKRFLFPLAIGTLMLAACAELAQVAQQVGATAATTAASTAANGGKLSVAEITSGLKEALVIGATKSALQAATKGGYSDNKRLFIPFPAEAQKVKSTLLQLGMTKQINDFEQALNRAAEEAAKEAKPIVVDAIKSMTVQDAVGILQGDSTAATEYLRRTTTKGLTNAFKPKVQAATQKVNLTSYWTPITTAYNKVAPFAGKQSVNTDLDAYVTQKAIDGLFVLIGDEEKNIRKDPKARVTSLLQRVFGNIYNVAK